MSTYTDYSASSLEYDRTRVPIGLEIILGCLVANGRAPSDLHLLDAGCGTGAYAGALAENVRRIDAIDINPDMLAVAQRKLSTVRAEGHITFHRGRVDQLPFANGAFGGVIVNQVLHHLEIGDDPSYPGHRRAIEEICRVLEPGGVVIINACTHEQLRQGFWCYHLVPRALAQTLRRCAPSSLLVSMLTDAGLEPRGRFVPVDAVLQGKAYFNPRGPLNARWRSGDSIWSLATPAEIEHARKQIKKLDRKEALEAYVGGQDAVRPRIGQATFFCARKPASGTC